MGMEVDEVLASFARGVLLLAGGQNNAFFADYRRLACLDESELFKVASAFFQSYSWKAEMANPDSFYAALQYGLSTNFSWGDKKEFNGISRDGRINLFLEKSYASLDGPELATITALFEDSCRTFNKLPDTELVRLANEQISVEYKDICGQAGGQLFTKLNHGFWEFFLNGYSDYGNEDYAAINIRNLKSKQRPDGAKRSAFYGVMRLLMERALTPSEQNKRLRFAIGLVAGNEKYNKVINRSLNEVTRGALMGMLSFIKASGGCRSMVFEDGAEPRQILDEGRLGDFIEEYVHTADACIVVAPSHLKDIVFPAYAGDVYFLSMPAKYIHEEWRSVLPTVLGLIDRLQERYSRITVLAQGANFATMLAFAINSVGSEKAKENLYFFDLGRALDIANPEICAKWPSFADILKRLGTDPSRYVSIKPVANRALFVTTRGGR